MGWNPSEFLGIVNRNFALSEFLFSELLAIAADVERLKRFYEAIILKEKLQEELIKGTKGTIMPLLIKTHK